MKTNLFIHYEFTRENAVASEHNPIDTLWEATGVWIPGLAPWGEIGGANWLWWSFSITYLHLFCLAKPSGDSQPKCALKSFLLMPPWMVGRGEMYPLPFSVFSGDGWKSAVGRNCQGCETLYWIVLCCKNFHCTYCGVSLLINSLLYFWISLDTSKSII